MQVRMARGSRIGGGGNGSGRVLKKRPSLGKINSFQFQSLDTYFFCGGSISIFPLFFKSQLLFISSVVVVFTHYLFICYDLV